MDAPAAALGVGPSGREVRSRTSTVLESNYLNIADLREGARRRLPKGLFEFLDRGSEDELSLEGNREAFRRIRLRNRVLVDVSTRSTATELFGKPLTMPLAIAPTGAAGLTWYEGELELARAAARFGVPFTLSTPAITAIESIASVEGGRNWFQLYLWRERELSHALVRRARDAGFEVLILTVDTPVPSIREYNRRNGFTSPLTLNRRAVIDVALHPRWFVGVLLRYMRAGGIPKHVHYPADGQGRMTSITGAASHLRGDNLTWSDVSRLREIWNGPLVLKGVHLAEDASRAVSEGLDGIVVSNHGGRNLDSAVAPIEVLPEIVAEVGDKLTVLVDSGVRRGGDILKAIALGAKVVLSGRCTLYGTAVAGEAGAVHALSILRKELDTCMAYTGCRSVGDIGPAAVWFGAPVH